MPDFSIEDISKMSVIGIDEVGRGPLAGPVVAAAVHIPQDKRALLPDFIKDSKKMSLKQRIEADKYIKEHSIFAIAKVNVEQIDNLNILEAAKYAMRLSYKEISNKISNINSILVDGRDNPFIVKNKLLDIDNNKIVKTIIGGDDISMSIACASIIAKVYRDNLMEDLAKDFPFYGWEKNAGYGTKLHKEGLLKHGITEHHRKSFKPIRELVNA